MAAKRPLLNRQDALGRSPHPKGRLFGNAKGHDLPGAVALSVLAVLEIVSAQFFEASDQIGRYGLTALIDGRYQFQPDIGIAGLSLPFVIAAWLVGKSRPVRVLFRIAIGSLLIGLVVLVLQVLGTINTRTGNLGRRHYWLMQGFSG